MTDPFCTPGLKITPPQRKPGEPLWALRKGMDEIRAELRSHGEYGTELQLLRNGTLLFGRRWNLRQSPLEEAADHRCDYERKVGARVGPFKNH